MAARPDRGSGKQPTEEVSTDEIADLVQRAASGEKQAFAELCIRFEGALYRLSYRLVGNEADAMDVVQNSLLRGYKSLSTYDGDRSFRTWLSAITVNEARRLLQRRSSTRALPLDGVDDGLVPTNSSDRLEALTRSELKEALDRVPADERTAFVLRYVERHTPGEVGELMDVSERTVRRLCQGARARLRKLLGGTDGE